MFTNGKYVRKPCIVCGKISKNVKYCSIRCQKKFEWGERKKIFEQTGAIEGCNHEVSLRRFLKKYLLDKTGHVCSICGNSKWMGQDIPLIFDHIDGHSENHEMSNLRLICGNCDMQLPTYKSKNRGNGRAFRRKRYADGKTY